MEPRILSQAGEDGVDASTANITDVGPSRLPTLTNGFELPKSLA